MPIHKHPQLHTPLFSLFCLLFLAMQANAGSNGDQYSRAFLLAHKPNIDIGSSYRAHPGYSFTESWEHTSSGRSSADTSATITRNGTGRYTVRIKNFTANNGIAHVSAYGGNHLCTIRRWYSSGNDLLAQVYCFSNSGSRVNGKFTFLYYQADSAPSYYRQAYAWAQYPSYPIDETYYADSYYQFNSTGSPIEIERVGVGSYDVRIPGFSYGGNYIKHLGFLVTAYGPSPRHCITYAMGIPDPDGSTGVDYSFVKVKCFDHNGVPRDTQFTISMMDNRLYGAEYLLDLLKSFSNAGVPSDDVQRLSTGRYRVSIQGSITTYAATALLSSVNTDKEENHCNIRMWRASEKYENGTDVFVDCFTTDGARVDSEFYLNYFTSQSYWE